jgi:hypothetical protein
LAQAKLGDTESGSRHAAELPAMLAGINASRTPHLLEELFDDALLTDHPLTIRTVGQAVLDRVGELLRLVEHEKALSSVKGIAPQNPELHVALPAFQKLRASVEQQYGAWRKANPPLKERIASLDRQIEAPSPRWQCR